MNTSLEKFQNLLRELFQFDCADPDFGMYRIANHKRDAIEQFIAGARALEPIFKARMFAPVEV
jgi:hypothetical protein